jgi:hypothetical protein
MKAHVVIGVVVVALVALAFLMPPLVQPLSYHDFADRRACLLLPNCLDAASNVFFVLAGGWGLIVLFGLSERPVFIDPGERLPYALFFLAVVLIGLVSAYYHLAPDTARLAWDRAAMALAFMAWLSALLAERVGVNAGVGLLAPLCAAGLGAVFYWSWGEAHGAGDLRPWLLVELIPVVLVPLLLWLYPPRYSHGGEMLAVVGIYLAALLFDLSDRAVFTLSDGLVSGHTLKHLVAALAAWLVAHYLRWRRAL